MSYFFFGSKSNSKLIKMNQTALSTESQDLISQVIGPCELIEHIDPEHSPLFIRVYNARCKTDYRTAEELVNEVRSNCQRFESSLTSTDYVRKIARKKMEGFRDTLQDALSLFGHIDLDNLNRKWSANAYFAYNHEQIKEIRVHKGRRMEESYVAFVDKEDFMRFMVECFARMHK